MPQSLPKIPPRIQFHYNAVARQQALFSPLLPPRLERCAVDYYLLFRILDTVEDTEFAERPLLLREIAADFLPGLEKASHVLARLQTIPLSYQRLASEWNLICDFHSGLEKADREMTEETGRKMAEGMLALLDREGKTLGDLEEYCYIAAGIVGELNVRLFGMPDELEAGRELGNYLQCVNIIRDRKADAARGRAYFAGGTNDIIAHARKKEATITPFLERSSGSGAHSYCETLFKVARVHFDAYSAGQAKPAPAKIFAALPASLKWRFLRYKLISMTAF